MMHGERNIPQISPFSTLPWEYRPGRGSIDDIEELGLNINTRMYVCQGEVFQYMPGSGITAIASEGYGKCSAVIIHNPENGSLTYAHAQPLDLELYREMAELDFGSSPEVVIVFGKNSVHQIRLENMLIERGARITHINVDTGGTHFGVALNTQTGKVSVVRTAPDQSILEYDPFGLCLHGGAV